MYSSIVFSFLYHRDNVISAGLISTEALNQEERILFFISQERNFVPWSEQSMDVFIRLWSTLDPDEACISSKILIMQNWKLDRMFNIWWCYKISRSYKIIINHTLLRLNYYDLNIRIICNVSTEAIFGSAFYLALVHFIFLWLLIRSCLPFGDLFYDLN